MVLILSLFTNKCEKLFQLNVGNPHNGQVTISTNPQTKLVFVKKKKFYLFKIQINFLFREIRFLLGNIE